MDFTAFNSSRKLVWASLKHKSIFFDLIICWVSELNIQINFNKNPYESQNHVKVAMLQYVYRNQMKKHLMGKPVLFLAGVLPAVAEVFLVIFKPFQSMFYHISIALIILHLDRIILSKIES